MYTARAARCCRRGAPGTGHELRFIMRYAWRFPEDVCGNGDDIWVHGAVVLFTLVHAAYAPKGRAVPLALFALLEATHAYAHIAKSGRGPWLWAFLHYTVIVCAYSIKASPLKRFVPFLCIDIIGRLLGNDMISIATTLSFAATRFDSVGMRVCLACTFVAFAFVELVACEWSDGHLHETWDMVLAIAMMAGVRWYKTRPGTGDGIGMH